MLAVIIAFFLGALCGICALALLQAGRYSRMLDEERLMMGDERKEPGEEDILPK